MTEIFAEGRAVSSGYVTAYRSENFSIYLVLAEVTQGLDYRTALAPCGGHVSRGSTLEEDFALANIHLSGRTISQEHNPRWNLIGETEHVGGISAGWLQTNRIPHSKRMSNGIGGGRDSAENRILDWVIIKTAGKLADGIRCL